MLPLPAENSAVVSTLRKLQPTAKMPTPSVIRQLQAADVRLLERRLVEPVEYVASGLDRPDAEQFFMADLPAAVRRRRVPANDDSGVDMLAGASAGVPTVELEQRLFLRLNFCRMRVLTLLEAFAGKRLSAEATIDLVRWERASMKTRAEVVRANVPLVLAMAKRTRITGVDFADLISEGNLALLRSVDKFDCTRGFKFSTYACRAILKSFSRVASRSARHRGYFPTEFDPSLEKSTFSEQQRRSLEGECLDELKSMIGSDLSSLSEVERRVIKARFALEARGDAALNRAMTLEQVGEMIGVTKERVRQIQNKALSKLRALLEDGVLSPH